MRYDFPVSIQDIFTKEGKQVPRVRAVVNDETGEALAPVSTKYALIEHKTIIDEAMKFAGLFGAPEVKTYTSRNGDRAVAEFTFADKTVAIKKGDLVGLRVYAENSYNAKSSAKIQIGALQLVCMNGLMMPRTSIALNIRHMGTPEIKFPETDEVWHKFTASANVYSKYAEFELSSSDFGIYAEEAVKEGVVTERALKSLKGNTVWDLYSSFTYDITHNESDRSSYLGKLKRLNRVSEWFDERFHVAEPN